MRNVLSILGGVVLATILSVNSIHAAPAPAKATADVKFAIFTPDEVTWGPAPDALPPGAMLAVVSGNPGEAGLYTILAKMPAGYKIPAHWHPDDENVTVLSGTFYLGNGETFDKGKMKAMPAGSVLG